jgi:hypothetical protein
MSPLQLFHLDLGDGYAISAAQMRGLRQTDIKKLLGWHNFWANKQDENENFLQRQPVGTTLHYHNSGNAYVRYEVVLDNGVKKLKSVALVGEWHKHDLPHRCINGEISYPYHAQKIIDGELRDSLQVSTTYESPEFRREGRIDPRKLQPISLDVPDMTPDQAESARLWKLISAVKDALEQRHENLDAFSSEYPRRNLEAAKELLKAA